MYIDNCRVLYKVAVSSWLAWYKAQPRLLSMIAAALFTISVCSAKNKAELILYLLRLYGSLCLCGKAAYSLKKFGLYPLALSFMLGFFQTETIASENSKAQLFSTFVRMAQISEDGEILNSCHSFKIFITSVCPEWPL